MTNKSTNSNFIALGHIARPHGVHGAVVLVPYTDNLDLILKSQNLLIQSPNATHLAPLEIAKGKVANQGLIIKIKNITTREAALGLKGHKVGLTREHLPNTDDDELYLADILGMKVETIEGEHLGEVTNFIEVGNTFLLVVILAPNTDEKLIPFHDEFIASVDSTQRLILIDPPLGFLDL
ncbi:MAG: ribosome maturation factor RimM [Candidatus Adiutrix sp.]